jgi:hypothetical protein
MTEINERPFEERLAEVTQWVKTIGERGRVVDIDPKLVLGVLEGLGAAKEISEEAKKSLARYSNLNKRPGLNAVWGKERVDAFKEWVKGDLIPQYEQRVGKELHTLWDPKAETFDNVKHSGMMQFLGELTAFAEGVMPLDEYRRLTQNRVGKGIKFEFGDPYEPYKPSKNASFPPEFPLKALNFLISSKSE